jgi:hypothetical protein
MLGNNEDGDLITLPGIPDTADAAHKITTVAIPYINLDDVPLQWYIRCMVSYPGHNWGEAQRSPASRFRIFGADASLEYTSSTTDSIRLVQGGIMVANMYTAYNDYLNNIFKIDGTFGTQTSQTLATAASVNNGLVANNRLAMLNDVDNMSYAEITNKTPGVLQGIVLNFDNAPTITNGTNTVWTLSLKMQVGTWLERYMGWTQFYDPNTRTHRTFLAQVGGQQMVDIPVDHSGDAKIYSLQWELASGSWNTKTVTIWLSTDLQVDWVRIFGMHLNVSYGGTLKTVFSLNADGVVTIDQLHYNTLIQ